MHDEGNADFMQKGDAGIVHARGVQDDAIGGAARFQIPIGLFLGFVGDDGKDHVIAVARIGLARACDEVGEDRVDDFMPCGQRDDMAHGQRPPGGKADGAGIGAVIVPLGRGHDPFTGGFVHLRVAVQRAADGGGRQPQLGGQFLEVHWTRISKPISIGWQVRHWTCQGQRLSSASKKTFSREIGAGTRGNARLQCALD